VAADADDDFPQDYLVQLGWVAVVSSTLDHTTQILLAYCEGAPHYDGRGASGRKETRRRLRVAVEARVAAGELSRDMGDFVLAWALRATSLLERRDRVVHALWSQTPGSGEVWGSHRLGAVPTTAGELRELVLESRTHMLEWTTERQQVVRDAPPAHVDRETRDRRAACAPLTREREGKRH
jgi:hypothetical protein